MERNALKLAAVLTVALAVASSGAGIAHARWEFLTAPLDRLEAPPSGPEVQGRVTAMNLAGPTVMLDDGTVLHLTDSSQIALRDVEERTVVRATYEERGGEKFATSLKVQEREYQAP